MATAIHPTEWENLSKGISSQTGGNGSGRGIVLPPILLEKFIRETEEIGRDEKISPEILYKVPTSVTEHIETPKILRVRAIIQESIDCLSDALNKDDEIERESVMNLFAESIFKLTVFVRINKNFKDAICLIQTAIEGQIKSVYTRKKILILKKVLALMKDNILMDEETLDECFDLLEAADFDINMPLAGIDLSL